MSAPAWGSPSGGSRGAANSLTDVSGVLVGHHHRVDGAVLGEAAALGSGWATGSTVVLSPGGAVGAVDVRGGGPGTRETDLLDPSATVQHVHAVLLTGGSAYGLAAADGVMRWAGERRIGLPMDGPDRVVPIVPAAVIFDLPVGGWENRPDADFGYRAAAAAADRFDTGSVGAGAGARAGALKGGIGTASVVVESEAVDGGRATVGALVVANPVGSPIDPATGLPWGLAAEVENEFGLRPPRRGEVAALAALAAKGTILNTTIGVVATDVALGKAACRRLAVAGQAGLTRAIRPAHSPLDGDTIFALSTGARAVREPDAAVVPRGMPVELPVLDSLCRAASECVERAIVHALLSATAVAGVPAYRDVLPSAFV